MKFTPENEVTCLELSKELKKLGYKQKGVWWWNAHDRIDENTNITHKDNFSLDNFNKWGNVCGGYESIVAPTVAELGEILPLEIIKKRKCYRLDISPNFNGLNYIDYTHYDSNAVGTFLVAYPLLKADTEANARAKMLIHLIKNKFIKP